MCIIYLHHDETALADEQSHCDSNAASIPGDEISTVFSVQWTSTRPPPGTSLRTGREQNRRSRSQTSRREWELLRTGQASEGLDPGPEHARLREESLDDAGKEALALRLKQRDRGCPSQCFTGPQVAQEWNTTQLVHVRWSGSTAGGTSKRGRVQNSPSGRVEGMEAKRTRGARLRRGIPPKNKELNGRQRKVTTTNKPSPACASTTPSKLLPCSRYTPTAGDVEKEMFAARRARKWVKET